MSDSTQSSEPDGQGGEPQQGAESQGGGESQDGGEEPRPQPAPAPSSGRKDGRIVSIAGPVIDVEFAPDSMPEINSALSMTAELEGETIEIVAEVAQHIGENRVKAICMKQPD